ncbi:S9 family peptidase [Tengunoibacter tsumagoiensis]|uniref:Putative peptidase YuxL n=1 Tax=Tengunoibacter tsumagoiensis TaxID=2014871 RepID=A0A401ZZF4_9CHLR|nr:S9 family peptidase [Tengunoibacter tsumagoiensis]GCE12226.1 putative peptidase YuxL [Tengunoibacter tsumagoiensis]
MARSITIDDLYHLKFLSRPRISPDGTRVAYVVAEIDEHKHAYRSSIWIADLATGVARRFTYGLKNEESPVWSPDGRWLAFVSSREGPTQAQNEKEEEKKTGKGKPQIWLLPIDGGEARQVTFMEHGASAPVWSPDGQQLVFSAQVGPADAETVEGKALPKARVIDRLWYRLDGVGFIYERRSHLFLINLSGGEPQQLTDGDWDNSDAAWSPDGKQLAFVSNRNEDRWRWPGDDVYVLSFQEGQANVLRRLTDGKLACNAPGWSPDGQQLAFIGSPKLHGAGQAYLYVLASDGSQAQPRCLSEEFEGSCADWTNSDVGDEHLAPTPQWSADGQSLYTLSAVHGATRLYQIPLTGSGSHPETLTPGDLHVRDFTIDASKQQLALLIGSPVAPQEIFVRSLHANGELRQLSHENDALLGELALARPELLTYQGADGWPIEGWILKPQNFTPSQKYPLVVEIHGGPATQYGYGFFHEMQLLVAEGYVVFYCNPRGSIGYGYDFSNAVRGAWGEKDSIDIMLGMKEVLKQGYIDEQRLGVTGGSYGGFMTNWLIGHYQDFKVAITDRCVSNMATMFGTSDIGWDLAEDNLETTPWENLDKYMHMSPIAYVKDMHTPLLILHSEQDLRCNIEQAEQLFAALKWMGREVEFVRFEGQSHGLSRGGHPLLRKVRLQYIKDWFAKYLQ